MGFPSIQKKKKKKSVNCTNIWSSNRKLGKHQQEKKVMTTAFAFLSATGKCPQPEHTFQGSFWIHHCSVVIGKKILGKWQPLKCKVKVRKRDFQGASSCISLTWHAVVKEYTKMPKKTSTVGPMKRNPKSIVIP